MRVEIPVVVLLLAISAGCSDGEPASREEEPNDSIATATLAGDGTGSFAINGACATGDSSDWFVVYPNVPAITVSAEIEIDWTAEQGTLPVLQVYFWAPSAVGAGSELWPDQFEPSSASSSYVVTDEPLAATVTAQIISEVYLRMWCPENGLGGVSYSGTVVVE